MTDFLPTASIEILTERARIIRRIRQFFDQREFLEVETPLVSRDTVIDRHLDPIGVQSPMNGSHSNGENSYWLQTSPEFCMKRLLAAGLPAIYQITHAFRLGESGNWHNPEFTMLEWYRVDDDLRQGMALLGQLAEWLFDTAPFMSITYRDAFIKFAGIDPFTATPDKLAFAVRDNRSIDSQLANESNRPLMIDCLWTELVQPKLGIDLPTIVYHYPSDQSALAQVIQVDGVSVAERFELFYRGVELANGYHELTDASELNRRNREVNSQRSGDGKAELPMESRLIDAMTMGLPKCAGVAMGIDRVVMLLTQANSISEVIPFPIDRA